MAHPLVFRIAPLAQLPEGETSWTALRALQGPSTGFSLRLFSAAETETSDLAALPWDGQLEPGGGGAMRRLICDAVVPHFDPRPTPSACISAALIPRCSAAWIASRCRRR